MMYRDALVRCPRCGSDLVDAAAARACSQCRGLWISIASMNEMTQAMMVPPHPVPLIAAVEARQPLPCPECTELMQTLVLHGVQIDACAKKHGVWFDTHELGTMLLRAAAG